jgi:hypothetical protein
MTEHEKAYQLKEQFHSALTSKECALAVVDEILDVIKLMPYGMQYLSARDYFEEVKEEIQKL